MPICPKCGKGYEAQPLSDCPYCINASFIDKISPLIKNGWFVSIGLCLVGAVALLFIPASKDMKGFFSAQLFSLAVLIAIVWSIFWAYKDANRHGKPGWLVALVVFLTWPIGLLIWLIIRA
jgi:hypothetical protein